MAHHSQPVWPGPTSSSSNARANSLGVPPGTAAHSHPPPFALPPPMSQTRIHPDDHDEEYDDDDGDDVVPELRRQPPPSTSKNEKQIRRRSSKACDQCRKSKCKCERTGDGEPCRSCIMLGTACTFLGPSRKRGPPKGYIDAIESRLHQTEALLGILISISTTGDSRARSLLSDLAQDSLARDIIARVDASPYGTKGRRATDVASSRTGKLQNQQGEDGEQSLYSNHPSNAWQDHVVSRLQAISASQPRHSHTSSLDSPPNSTPSNTLAYPSSIRPSLSLATLTHPISISTSGPTSAPPSASARRTRPRLNEPALALSPRTASLSLSPSQRHPLHSLNSSDDRERSRNISEFYTPEPESSEDEEVADAVGQLSLNEDAQVRYHGKASGLHLLGGKTREDGRNEGGIWRFPKARVWPPVLSDTLKTKSEEEFAQYLPPLSEQESLLELYFAYVHPVLPILHKRAFLEDFQKWNAARMEGSPIAFNSPQPDGSTNASGSSNTSHLASHSDPRNRISTLLLLSMFALAARYSSTPNSSLPPPPTMWPAGDTYLEHAKIILDSTYASSRPTTAQALLLMGYREIGIGAMAQSWLYVGMAVRMAQDLGLHKSADRWQRVGGLLFNATQQQERKRIWYACVIMDKYVSAYIGRPLSIFERDFDTPLPSVDDVEEIEVWKPHPFLPHFQGEDVEEHESTSSYVPVQARVISCFNQSAELSSILSAVVQALYSVRPVPGRHAESLNLEKQLDKWYLALPEHLRFEAASAAKCPIPPPHVLTLHMQYWCTLLLLHRPFIRDISGSRRRASGSPDSPSEASSQKNYDMCVQAANHITSIVSIYRDNFCLKRCPVFLSYYVFSAGIMHVTTLSSYPNDPQARIGLTKCMEALKRIDIVWPSAGRAWELLQGSTGNLESGEISSSLSNHPDRSKRSAEDPLDDDGDDDVRGSLPVQNYHRTGASTYSLGLELPVSDSSMPYSTSYEGWPDHPVAFPTSLSTSVLPQQYSTGLVDYPRMNSAMDRPHSSVDNSHRRMPQFWSEYAGLGHSPMMNSMFGMPIMGGVPSNTDPQNHPSGSYMGDQFNVFNNLPPSDHR